MAEEDKPEVAPPKKFKVSLAGLGFPEFVIEAADAEAARVAYCKRLNLSEYALPTVVPAES